jgi:hypothetical protein
MFHNYVPGASHESRLSLFVRLLPCYFELCFGPIFQLLPNKVPDEAPGLVVKPDGGSHLQTVRRAVRRDIIRLIKQDSHAILERHTKSLQVVSCSDTNKRRGTHPSKLGRDDLVEVVKNSVHGVYWPNFQQGIP